MSLFLSVTQLSLMVRLLAGLLQGQRAGAMWLVAGAGQNDEGRGKPSPRTDKHLILNEEKKPRKITYRLFNWLCALKQQSVSCYLEDMCFAFQIQFKHSSHTTEDYSQQRDALLLS